MLIYITIVNIIGFIICFIDKRRASKNKFRVKEKNLLLICALGGCLGFYIGMYVFHHKTRKIKFQFLVPILIIIWVALLFYN